MGPCERAASTSSTLGGAGSSFSCSDLNTCKNVVFPGSVSIKDLTVTGSQYIEHEVHLYIGDPLISLNTGVAGANTYDIGWVGERGSLTNVAAIWDESADQFALVSTPDDGSAHGNLTIDSYSTLKLGNLHVTGRVGAGTDNPSFRLQATSDELTNYVPSSATSTYPSGILFFGDNQNVTAGAALMGWYDRATVSTWYAGNAGSQNDGGAAPAYSGPFVVGNRTAASAYSEKFRIDSNGNVGVGTSTPSHSLEVTGSISGKSVRGDSVYATHLHDYAVQNVAPSNNYVLAWDNGDSRWEPKDIGTIGAATASNLDNGYTIYQNLRTTDDAILDSLDLQNTSIGLTSSGNVGIGTTNPSGQLHIANAGSGIIEGALAVGSTQPSGTVGTIVATNDIIGSYSSDQRLKDNISPIPDSLTKLSQIAGVEFDWNDKAYSHLHGHDVGVIAQEVETVLPEAVTTREDGYKAVKYEKIIPLLIEGFKEQEKRINALEKKLNSRT